MNKPFIKTIAIQCIACAGMVFLFPLGAGAQWVATIPLLIPIADGNMWVYTYHKNYHYSLYDRYTATTTIHDSIKNGIFRVSINSVLVRNDSVFFTVSTVDSGLITSSTSAIYDKRLTNDYLIADSVLFRKDALGAWLRYNEWYLDYLVQPDTSYTGYQRHTDTSNVTINGNNYLQYSAGMQFSETYYPNVWMGWSNTNGDTCRWIKNIGSSYKALSVNGWRFEHGGSIFGYDSETSENERWTLAFSNTIVILPTTPSVPRVFSDKTYSGILRYSLPKACHVSIRYFNLRGRLAASLINGVQCPGYYTLHIGRGDLPAGVYCMVFEAGTFVRRELVAIVGK